MFLLNDASSDVPEEHGSAQRAGDPLDKTIVTAANPIHGALGGIVVGGKLLDIGQQRQLIGIAEKKIAHAGGRRIDLRGICCRFSRYSPQVSFTVSSHPLGNALPRDGSGDWSLPFFSVQFIQVD